ncbi:neural Wiskott-Aldrich syndrome protein-like [Zerene cesonia]|uniref:neural Wiskott-Aldrich syndrome protein-like n=1 Tax=Zerene cesonia TaxID=33412 RepID=UPI0018E57AF9|nr:neural Wiskott-Aldrich syndrome protein-like [Zerene cesonia]
MPRGENRPSVLLSREENEQVFSLIGPKCQSLATAVVQLFTTEGPGHTEWKKKDTGVLCLIKDNSKRSYFFRIYCLYRKTMIWEHEVYMQIEYKSPRPYLHTFEAEEYMTAFNFANEDEAKVLRNILIEKIELRKQRREERRQRSMLAARANSSASSTPNLSARVNGVSAAHAPPAPAPAPAPAQLKSNAVSGSGYTLKGKKQKARKLTKADIGAPQDFKHISHVGWDADKGFDVDNLPEAEMKSFFFKAGISDSQLRDHATRQFIYDFINRNGGLDAVKEELHDAAPKASRAPPPPPARAVPPPPPPPAGLARNPPPRPLQPPSAAPPSVPPPPPPSAAPPPPPPPPPAPAPPPAAPHAPAPPAPPPPPDAPADAHDPRAALMESIRNGSKTLRHVEVGSKSSLNDDNRSNLLSEIRQGINLRAVNRVSGPVEERAPACGLAGALAKALQERARAIHSSDSEDSQTTSDGEWDD